VPDVRTEAHRLGVDMVIVDSLGAASGAEPETAGAALRTLQAVGSLPGTKLVIAHESKAALELNQGKPFGSVYVENTARSAIEMRPQETTEASSLSVTLRHAKHNDGPKAAPLGITFTFEPSGAVVIARSTPDLASQSLARRILDALQQGHASVDDLAKETDANPNTVKSALQFLDRRGKVMRVASVSGGRGKKTLWGLKLQTDDGELGN